MSANDGRFDQPATKEKREQYLREMSEDLQRQHDEREAERKASELREIERQKRWVEIFASMNLDEVIEIPGRQGDQDIVIRAIPGPGGRLKDVE